MTSLATTNNLTSYGLPSQSSGISKLSKTLREIVSASIEHLDDSIVRSKFDSLLIELNDIYHECSVDNWDGYGAVKMKKSAYLEAVNFISALPDRIPVPDAVPEPSGGIGFEWSFGDQKVFVASINGSKIISFAGLLGKDLRIDGTEIFDDGIPRIILDYVERISPKITAKILDFKI